MANADTGDPRRASPDALLQAMARAERSRLRLFVGAAPGVGKTYAMLQAARERMQDGVDVVIGVVETHGRAETQALVDGLDQVPRRLVEYRGHPLAEMDLDAILERRPAIVLVDELAHTNAPGSRHPKRYLDVEELLDAGIEVWSTVNIQHLESLNDVVAQITGVRVAETVPDRILDRADELRLIDLSPEELTERLREGKVYLPEQAERALQHFFQPGKLTALRELALRQTAVHVDEQVQAHLRSQSEAGVWPVAERLLVAVDGSPRAAALVRAARRVSERRGVPWFAVFVEPARFQERSVQERERLNDVLRLAEQLGGEAVTLPGPRVAEALLRYARERNATEILVGRPRASIWHWLRRSPVAELIRSAGPIEIRIAEGSDEAREAAPRQSERSRPALSGYALAVVSVAVAGGIVSGFGVYPTLEDPGLLFLLAVLVTAVGGGLWPSIAASLLGLCVYNFFFVEPTYTLGVSQPEDLLALGIFLVVAVVASQLTARARDQAEAAQRREQRTGALYAFTRDLTAAETLDQLLLAIADHVGRLFEAQVAVLLPEAGELRICAAQPPGTQLSAAERATARWAFEHAQRAGRGTDALPGSEWLHVPLASVRGVVGIVALHGHRGDRLLALEQRQLLDALADQAAVAIERTRIDAVLAEKAKTDAVIESIDDGLVVLDPAGVVVSANEIACAILDLDRREVLGRRFAELGTRHPHYLRLRAAVADFLAHPERVPEALEIAMFLRGRDHFFVLRPTPLSAPDGRRLGLVLALQDITYLRDQEARREQLMATLSHELRTPITSLGMATDLLAASHPPLPPEARSLVEAAREDTARLEDVARRLLEVSRSRAMSIALESGRVPLRELIESTLKLFALQAREQGIALEAEPPEQEIEIPGDLTKLSWALSNLIGNALRYTPRGGSIRVAVESTAEQVRLSVSDTGRGIPPEQRERIFEPFAQGSEPGSAGLGLAIVRDVVRAHGGRIFLESEVGRGSRFILELPRAGGSPIPG